MASQQLQSNDTNITQLLFDAYLDNNTTQMVELLSSSNQLPDLIDSFIQLRYKYCGQIENDLQLFNISLLKAGALTNSIPIFNTIIEKMNVDTIIHDTILHILASLSKKGEVEMFQYLFETYHITPESFIKSEERPLDYLNYNNTPLVQYIATQIMSVWSYNEKCRFIFELAHHGNLKALEFCIELTQFDIHDTSYGTYTLLHQAAESNSIELVEYCIDLGLPFDQYDDAGFSPIMCAIYHNGWDVVQHLITKHNVIIQKTDFEQVSPLIEICTSPKATPELIDLVINIIGDDDIEVVDDFIHYRNRTRLLDLAALGNITAMKHLIDKYNANVNVTDESECNILLLYLRSGEKCTCDDIKYIINLGIDVNHVDCYEHSALRVAIRYRCSLDVIETLIQLGAQYEDDCRSFIQVAVEYNHVEALPFLISKFTGGDLSVLTEGFKLSLLRNIGKNPFDLKSLTYLLSLNIQPQTITSNIIAGRTPLENALVSSHINLSVVQFLYENNFAVTNSDWYGLFSNRSIAPSVFIQCINYLLDVGAIQYDLQSNKGSTRVLFEYFPHDCENEQWQLITKMSKDPYMTWSKILVFRILCHYYQFKLDQYSPDGGTILHLSAIYKQLYLIKFICLHSSSMNQQQLKSIIQHCNNDKKTFLHTFVINLFKPDSDNENDIGFDLFGDDDEGVDDEGVDDEDDGNGQDDTSDEMFIKLEDMMEFLVDLVIMDRL